MNQVILIKYMNTFWGNIKIIKNGKIIAEMIESCNHYYEVTPDWIYLYESVGGQGTGYKRGPLTNKIYIGDCEFKEVEEYNDRIN